MEERLRASIEERLRELGWPLPRSSSWNGRGSAPGDWSTNVALAREAASARPREIAEELRRGGSRSHHISILIAAKSHQFRLASSYIPLSKSCYLPSATCVT